MSNPFLEALRLQCDALWTAHSSSLQRLKSNADDLHKENLELRKALQEFGQDFQESTAARDYRLLSSEQTFEDCLDGGKSLKSAAALLWKNDSSCSPDSSSAPEEANKVKDLREMVQRRKSSSFSSFSGQIKPPASFLAPAKLASSKRASAARSVQPVGLPPAVEVPQPGLQVTKPSAGSLEMAVEECMDVSESYPIMEDAEDELSDVSSKSPVQMGPVKSVTAKEAASSAATRSHVIFLKPGEERTGQNGEDRADDANSPISSSDSDEDLFTVADVWLAQPQRRRSTVTQIAMQQKELPAGATASMQPQASVTATPIVDKAIVERLRQSVLKDKFGNGRVKRVLLKPNSTFTLWWDAFSFILLSYDLVMIPLDVYALDETNTFLLAMSWIIRWFWTLDICVSFLTGYMDGIGRLVMDPQLVAWRYAARQLPIDVVIVGSDWVQILYNFSGTSVARSWRIVRVARLLRLKKARDIVERFGEYVRSEQIGLIGSIVRLLLLMVTLIHYMACSWYGIGDLSKEHLQHRASWTDRFSDDDSIGDRYGVSLHYAVALFHGEQVFLPQNMFERFFIACCLGIILVWNVWLVSTITTAMTHLEIVSTRRKTMSTNLDRWLNKENVSFELSAKVQRSARKHLDDKEKNLPEHSIDMLKLISDPLRVELHLEINSPALFRHPFFRCYAVSNPGVVKKLCHTGMSRQMYQADDLIFTEFDQPDSPKVFFVITGSCYYFKPSDDMFDARYVDRKNWISEPFIWTLDWVHAGNLLSETDSDLLAVDVASLTELISASQSIHAGIYARLFIERLNKWNQRKLTDVGEYTFELGHWMDKIFGKEWQNHSNIYESKVDDQGNLRRRSSIRRGFESVANTGKPRGHSVMPMPSS